MKIAAMLVLGCLEAMAGVILMVCGFGMETIQPTAFGPVTDDAMVTRQLFVLSLGISGLGLGIALAAPSLRTLADLRVSLFRAFLSKM